ncbi:hypothetical protein CLV59_102187 [Chitinophaga dinghuensis]|uniref:DUF6265 domain-containing protein n=2 Tax=Chitinophaga dinghuensis TaxID=1539050 RepID=A0A327W782_9BACT|nr:hypothetical protein CLV59_102187 [Chitinophaga dinghuensis]
MFTVAAQKTSPAFQLKQLSWLEGKWTRTNTKPGRSGYEEWKKITPLSWKGQGITLKGTDTAFVEQLALEVKKDTLYYVAVVAENNGPVYFRITEVNANGFICENSTHDFPKKIVYWRNGNVLRVITSDEKKSIGFLFQKQEKQ